MSEETLVQEAPVGEQPTPEQGATAAPESENQQQPEGVKAEEQQPPKTFTQEELDRVVAKRVAIEQRKLEKQLAALEASKREITPEDAVVIQKAQELLTQKQQEEIVSRYEEREIAAYDKYPDFRQVVYDNPDIRITQEMADIIRAAENGPDIAHYLGTNVKLSQEIANMPPLQQAMQLGIIKAKLEAAPPKPPVSKSPPPINPLGGGKGTAASSDPDKMSASEYEEYRRKNGASWAR